MVLKAEASPVPSEGMLKHRVWFLGCAVQGQELDAMILVSPFEFRIFHDLYIHTHIYIHTHYVPMGTWAFQAGLQQLQIPFSADKLLSFHSRTSLPLLHSCRGTSETLLPRKCAHVSCSHQEMISCRRFKQIYQTSLKRNMKSTDCFSAGTKGDTWPGAETGAGTRLCKGECNNFFLKWLQSHAIHLWRDVTLFLGHSFIGNFFDI